MLKKYGKEYFLGAIITLGIVYGDIGTSPLYVMNALIGDQGGVSRVTPNYIIGCLSLIFWTLMIITTIKYVVDRKSTRLNSSHSGQSRMPSSA